MQIDNNIKLYNKNSSTFLKSLNDKSVQSIYLDPPFNSKRDYQLTIDNDL